MPHDFNPQQLFALRHRIGFTQIGLAVTLNCTLSTVRSHERHGTNDRLYVDKLIRLVESRAHLPVPALRKGWPDKPWKLAQRSRKYGQTRARFLLFMEGHRDDMKALQGRPRSSESVTVWLERDTYKSKLWRKLAIRPDGTVDTWGIIPDDTLSYW